MSAASSCSLSDPRHGSSPAFTVDCGDGVPRCGGRGVGPCRRTRRTSWVLAKMRQDVAWHRRAGFFIEPPLVSRTNVPSSNTRICGSSSASDPAGENMPGSGFGMPAMYTRCVTDGSPAAASWITSHPYDQPTATTGGRALAMVRRTSAASAVSPTDPVRCDGRSGTTTSTSLSRKRSATHRQSAGLDHIP
jgi:hypothetical protein